MHALGDLRLRRPHRARPHREAEGDVVEHAHVAEERVVLEHEADLALARTLADGVLAMEAHGAGVRPLEAGHDAQQRGLAGTGGAEQGQQLARLHLERHPIEGEIVAEALADVEDLDAHGDTLPTRSGAKEGHSLVTAWSLKESAPRSLNGAPRTQAEVRQAYHVASTRENPQ